MNRTLQKKQKKTIIVNSIYFQDAYRQDEQAINSVCF